MDRLFEALTVIHKYKKLYEKRCQGLMKTYDLKIADIDVLYYMSHAGDRNLAKDVVDEGMSKANVSKSVEHLRRKGYVALYEDREDRRCIHIQLTEAAEPVVAQIKDIRLELAQVLTKGISSDDREVIARVMEQMSINMSDEMEG